MSKLTCDICGGKIVVQSGGVAVCEQCGIECSKERLQEKLNLTDNNVPQQTQCEKWMTLANEAFNNAVYEEAYSFYCKVLEENPSNWEATYKKGICIASESTIGNPKILQAASSAIDALNKLDSDDSVNDIQYSEVVADMILALNSLYSNCISTAFDYVRRVGEYSEDAIITFFEFMECVIVGMKTAFELLNERAFFNYQNTETLHELVVLTKEVAETAIEAMEFQLRCEIGGHFNIFDVWVDDYVLIGAPPSGIDNKNELKEFMSEKESLYNKWFAARANAVSYEDLKKANTEFVSELESITDIIDKIDDRIKAHPELAEDDDVKSLHEFFIPKISELIRRYEDAILDNEDTACRQELQVQVRDSLNAMENAAKDLIGKFKNDEIIDLSAELTALQTMLSMKGY